MSLQPVSPAAGAIYSRHATSPDAPSLPWTVHYVDVAGLKIAVYDSGGPDGQQLQAPLLLVHSMHAVASAFEWQPLMQRQARQRRVVAVDLPGCGLSDKPELAYTPALMSAAITATIDWINAAEVDIAALSLGCEFAALATFQRPGRVRSLALVAPTGMEGRRAHEHYKAGRTRGSHFVRRLLRENRLGRLLYRVMTTRLMIHMFMSLTWGTQAYDKALLRQARACAQRPGARHVALNFIAGNLFSYGIIEIYRALPVPVWVAHGDQGAFTNFSACPQHTGDAAQGASHAVKREVFDGGAMPHFEWPDAFNQAYRRFLSSSGPGSLRWQQSRAPQSQNATTPATWGAMAR